MRLKNAIDPQNNADSREESNNTVLARQAEKAVRLKGATGAANSTVSNKKNDNSGSDLKTVDGSDKGSGIQVSFYSSMHKELDVLYSIFQ